MKREVLLRYLCSQGCALIREGGRHSWWHNPALNKRSAIPRHTEIRDILAKKICKDIGIPPEIKERGEKTMGDNGHLLSQLEQAGKLHGHICPSLFYGVSLAMRISEWMQANSNRTNRADGAHEAACEIILEGKSQCIHDGVRSVLGEGTPFTVQSTGQCALTAVCTTDACTTDVRITNACITNACTTDQHSCTDQHISTDQPIRTDQQRYRLSISPAVRSRINELNQTLPLEEFKRVGVAYLKSLSPRELFGE